MSVENVSETVAKVLASQRENESKYKSIEVFKEVEPNIDIGNLLLNDLQPVSTQEFKRDKETYLKTLSRNNLQLLFNQIWKLPIERIEDAVVVKLPECTTLLPREKPIPKPKAPTKWEEYAKKKDIQNKKRTRMVWDEEAGKYKPRTGYQRANDNTKEWCIEVPVNAKDDKEDQFEKHENEKKERVAKNELKRLSNIVRNSKNKQGSILSSQLKPTQKKDKERVTKEIDIAKVSTASMGKFQQKLPKEKENKKQGKKRKFDSVTANSTKEKDRALEILKKINKPNQVDLTSAVNKKVAQTQLEESSQKKKGSGKVKNKRFRKGKQSTMDKMKGKTLGKGRKKK